MTVEYLDYPTASFATDLALLDVLEKHYRDDDMADNIRAKMAAGKPLPRLVDVAKALDVPLDVFLKEFLTEVHDRTGIVYEVHGFLFKRRTN
jgi:hypothetical protein